MARLGQRFDATAHDTEQRPDYEELPNGIYRMEVTEADVAPTKSGNGTILKTVNEVVEPEDYKGRKIFNNYNLENVSAQAQEIGQRQFASLCRAMGIDGVEDTDELLYKQFTVKVGLGKPSKDGQYPARAGIKTYYFPDQGNVPVPAIDANQPARPANDNAQPATTAQAGGAKKVRPWG